MTKALEKYQGTENYLWNKFETAIDEQFLGGGTMPEVEADYQPLADALGWFWQHAVSPRVQAMMLLATHPAPRCAKGWASPAPQSLGGWASPLFSRYDYQTRTDADGVIITITPGTKWFSLVVIITGRGVSFQVNGDKHTAYSEAVFFDRKGVTQDAPELLNRWHENHPEDYMALADGVEHTIIADYTMILHAIVARGVEICQSLENAVVTTAERYDKGACSLVKQQ